MKRGPKPTATPEDWVAGVLSAMRRTDGLDFSITEVARSLGVTKGSFYHHFSSKPEIIEQALESWLDRENELLGRIGAGPAIGPREFVDAIFQVVREFEYPLVFFLVGLSRKHAEFGERVHAIQASRMEFVATLFASWGVDADRAERASIYLLSVFVGLSYLEFARLLDVPSVTRDRDARWSEVASRTAKVVEAMLAGESG